MTSKRYENKRQISSFEDRMYLLNYLHCVLTSISSFSRRRRNRATRYLTRIVLYTDVDAQTDHTQTTQTLLRQKKGKVFPYSLPSVGPGDDPGVQTVSPQVT